MLSAQSSLYSSLSIDLKFFFLLKSISCELSARRLKLLKKDDRISFLLGIPHEFFEP